MLYNQGKKATSKLKMFAGFVGAMMMAATSYAANITVTGGVNDIDGGDTVTITLTNVQPGDATFQNTGTATTVTVNSNQAIGVVAGTPIAITANGTFQPGDTITNTTSGVSYTVASVVNSGAVTTSVTFTTAVTDNNRGTASSGSIDLGGGPYLAGPSVIPVTLNGTLVAGQSVTNTAAGETLATQVGSTATSINVTNTVTWNDGDLLTLTAGGLRTTDTYTISHVAGAPNVNAGGVTFGGVAGTVATVTSATTLTVVTPAKAVSTGAGPVTVIVNTLANQPGGGPYALVNGYTYQPEINPFVSNSNPVYINAGTTANGVTVPASTSTHHNNATRPVTGDGFGFTITGRGFTAGCGVTIDGVACSSIGVNATGTALTVAVPASVTSGPGGKTIVVTNPNFTTCSATNFIEYLPTITSVDVDGAAAEGPVGGGTLVTVRGTGFVAGATSLTIGATGSARAATIATPVQNATAGVSGTSVQTNTDVTDLLPATDDLTGPVTDVTVIDDTTLTFKVAASQYDDDHQSGDKIITILANNKTNNQNVTGFHSDLTSGGASFRFVPTINALLVNADGTSNTASGLQPLSGEFAGGYTVAINGSGFRNSVGVAGADTTVTIGGINAPIVSNNGSQLVVTMPAFTATTIGRKDVIVRVEDGTTDPTVNKAKSFAVNAGAPAIDPARQNTSEARDPNILFNNGVPMSYAIFASNFPIFYDVSLAPTTATYPYDVPERGKVFGDPIVTLADLGLSVNNTNGVISGTPIRDGYYVFYTIAKNTTSTNIVQSDRQEIRVRVGSFNGHSVQFDTLPFATPPQVAPNTNVTFEVPTVTNSVGATVLGVGDRSSADAYGDGVTLYWDFGDGQQGVVDANGDIQLDENRKQLPVHKYTSPGSYTVTCVATDGGTRVLKTLTVVVDSTLTGGRMVVQSAKLNLDFRNSDKSQLFLTGLMDIPTKNNGFTPTTCVAQLLSPSSDGKNATLSANGNKKNNSANATAAAAALTDDTLTNDLVGIDRGPTGVNSLAGTPYANYGMTSPVAVVKTDKSNKPSKGSSYTWGDTNNRVNLKIVATGQTSGRAAFQVTFKKDPNKGAVLGNLENLLGQVGTGSDSADGFGYLVGQTVSIANKRLVGNRLVLNIGSSQQLTGNPSLNRQYDTFIVDYTAVSGKFGKGNINKSFDGN